MPSLRLFGRQWGMASDDFVFPQVTEAILRSFWFIAALIIFCLYSSPDDCPNGAHLRLYIEILMFLNAVTILQCYATALVSSRGTILETQKRRMIPHLIYARLPVFLVEVVWNIFGTIWALSPVAGCELHVVWAVRVTAILGWLVVVWFLAGAIAVFDPLGTHYHREHHITRERAKRLWHMRLRCFCLCASGDDNAKSAFEDVADLLGEFFTDADMVISDVWAGLLLLANRDLCALTARSSLIGRDVGEPQPITAADEPRPHWMNVELAARMMRFALGAYGWPYYVWNRCGPKTWSRLVKKLKCCRQCQCDQVLINKDNCCLCNTASFLLQTGIAETDLFYASFHNRICEVPFVACADQLTKSIVVAIRGSLSLRDVVTDLCMCDESLCLDIECEPCTSEPANGGGGGGGGGGLGRVHRGMLQSAKYVQRVLDSQKILDDLFVLYPDYQLVVTGHSLGAGVASLLALLLRGRYPQTRCFAFSPPGCVVSSEAIAATRRSVCGVVVGDDLVPRLSYQSLQRLKLQIAAVVENCDRPKYDILLKGCFKLLCGPSMPRHRRMSEADAEAAGYMAVPGGWNNPISTVDGEGDGDGLGPRRADSDPPPDPTPPPTAAIVADDAPLLFRARPAADSTASASSAAGYGTDYCAETQQSVGSTATTTVATVMGARCRMHAPGRLMYVTSLADDAGWSEDPVDYLVSWCDHRKFTEIKLSSRMVADHLPVTVSDVLNRAAAASNRSTGDAP